MSTFIRTRSQKFSKKENGSRAGIFSPHPNQHFLQAATSLQKPSIFVNFVIRFK